MTETPISLVIPCYNPLEGWHDNVVECFKKYQDQLKGVPVHLILVNDGSARGVEKKHIEKISSEIPEFTYHKYEENRGKGHALREGVRLVNTKLAVTTDIDFPYENHSMVALTQKLLADKGLILGHRKKDYYQKVPLFRKVLSLSFRATLKLLLRLNVEDTQCGLKGMDEKVMEVFKRTDIDGYLYDLQLVAKVQAAQLKVGRVEVRLKSGVEFTNMKASILIKELKNFLKIWRQSYER